MIAHIRRSDGAVQSLIVHNKVVSQLCSKNARRVGLEKLAAIIGLMHDMGKATLNFKRYLYGHSDNLRHHHSPVGAIYAYKNWFDKSDSLLMRLCAQIIMLCILGHHHGLKDCLEFTGESPLIKSVLNAENNEHFEEASEWFLKNVADADELDALFSDACAEIAALFPNLTSIKTSSAAALRLICRLLLSILVDADRWDAACFEYGEDPLACTDANPDWNSLLSNFEDFRKANLISEGRINRIRSEISDICFAKADSAPGIFSLSVPTGGGKTFASLRFALRHAALNSQRRIFYIIPYNTILDQNAKAIRTALNDYPSILEHHSNVVIEDDDKAHEHTLLTERWDSDIILTSLVQFLNACYKAPNSNARRFHRLTNSVLIFDEFQAAPKHCNALFERAIDFLSKYCHTTVVLCTATQPTFRFNAAPVELMPDVGNLYKNLARVHYIFEPDNKRTYETAGASIAQLAARQSVLVVMNTRRSTLEVFEQTVRFLKVQGTSIIMPDVALSKQSTANAAIDCPDGAMLCVCMSTLLCANHRLKLIECIKAWLGTGKRVLCISTTLIEAGINISFPMSIRALAGLPSIIQVAGRTNRNMEYPTGEVRIWDFSQENAALSYLEDVQRGADLARGILADPAFIDKLESPEIIEGYFKLEADYIAAKQKFPVKAENGQVVNLTDLLALNKAFENAANGISNTHELVLRQSFEFAAKSFFVIPDDTKSVIVPWGEGADIIAALKSPHDMRTEMKLLRKAQAYSVSLYENDFNHLYGQGAIEPIGESGVLALKEGFYDNRYGARMLRKYNL